LNKKCSKTIIELVAILSYIIIKHSGL